MKQLTVLLITIGLLFGLDQLNAQTKKKSKPAHKDQMAEWKEARNGATLSVKWELKVGAVFDERVWCYLWNRKNPYDTDHRVNVHNVDIAIHSDDIIIVKGQTMGVNNSGEVSLNAELVENKGVE